MRKALKNPAFRFFLSAFFLYILWFLLYDLWLHPAQLIDPFIINLIVDNGRFLLELLHYETFEPGVHGISRRTLGIVGGSGVWVGDPCNGISLFALFSGFIIAYPGPIKTKLWYIPLGLLSIHVLNVLRVAALAIIEYKWPHALDFNHTYTFTILVYSWVFFLWYHWSNRTKLFLKPDKPEPLHPEETQKPQA